MKRMAAAALAAFALVPVTEASAAQSPVRYPATRLADRYSAMWHKAHRACGECPGRNIRRYGYRHPGGKVRRATWHQVMRSLRVLRQMTAPRRPARRPAAARNLADDVVHDAGLPACTWVPESGGSYTARNPTSTAGGKYQIIDTTWHAYGGPDYPGDHDAAQAPPALQEQIARRVYAGQGPGAWVNC